MRLAAASPAQVKSSNGTAWTYWDLPSRCSLSRAGSSGRLSRSRRRRQVSLHELGHVLPTKRIRRNATKDARSSAVISNDIQTGATLAHELHEAVRQFERMGRVISARIPAMRSSGQGKTTTRTFASSDGRRAPGPIRGRTSGSAHGRTRGSARSRPAARLDAEVSGFPGSAVIGAMRVSRSALARLERRYERQFPRSRTSR